MTRFAELRRIARAAGLTWWPQCVCNRQIEPKHWDAHQAACPTVQQRAARSRSTPATPAAEAPGMTTTAVQLTERRGQDVAMFTFPTPVPVTVDVTKLERLALEARAIGLDREATRLTRELAETRRANTQAAQRSMELSLDNQGLAARLGAREILLQEAEAECARLLDLIPDRDAAPQGARR